MRLVIWISENRVYDVKVEGVVVEGMEQKKRRG